MSALQAPAGTAGGAVAAFSILAPGAGVPAGDRADPDTLSDLRLDQVISALVAGHDEAERMGELFSTPLHDPDVVRYRQEVFTDLGSPELRDAAGSFVERLAQVRRRLSAIGPSTEHWTAEARFLDAAAIYCGALESLAGALADAATGLRSGALRALTRWLGDHIAAPGYAELAGQTRQVKETLSRVTYCVRVKGLRVEVSRYRGEPDYATEVAEVFRRFARDEGRRYHIDYPSEPALGHVGEAILGLVAGMWPEEFSLLDSFCARHASFVDPTLEQLSRDLEFYLCYLGYLDPIHRAGLPTCVPDLEASNGDETAVGSFDLALAAKLVADGSKVVVNDFALEGDERVIVVSGPNQGGKTTFSRTFGQLHHLASIGCPVPASRARLILADRVYTHFAREEQRDAEIGRLEEDLVRVGRILASATESSVIVMNEPFSGTALADSRFLGRKALTRILQIGARAVYITFVDELSRLGPEVVSMVSTVVAEDPSRRTFRVVRAPADGLAHALALAERNRVTYRQLAERLGR